jgi:glycerol uptake facilitator-like aquaporin
MEGGDLMAAQPSIAFISIPPEVPTFATGVSESIAKMIMYIVASVIGFAAGIGVIRATSQPQTAQTSMQETLATTMTTLIPTMFMMMPYLMMFNMMSMFMTSMSRVAMIGRG